MSRLKNVIEKWCTELFSYLAFIFGESEKRQLATTSHGSCVSVWMTASSTPGDSSAAVAAATQEPVRLCCLFSYSLWYVTQYQKWWGATATIANLIDSCHPHLVIRLTLGVLEGWMGLWLWKWHSGSSVFCWCLFKGLHFFLTSPASHFAITRCTTAA